MCPHHPFLTLRSISLSNGEVTRYMSLHSIVISYFRTLIFHWSSETFVDFSLDLFSSIIFLCRPNTADFIVEVCQFRVPFERFPHKIFLGNNRCFRADIILILYFLLLFQFIHFRLLSSGLPEFKGADLSIVALPTLVM